MAVYELQADTLRRACDYKDCYELKIEDFHLGTSNYQNVQC